MAAVPFDPSGPHSKLTSLAHRIIQAYNSRSHPSILSFRTADCLTTLRGQSLPEGRVFTNAEYAEYTSSSSSQFRDLNIAIHKVLENEAEGKVTFYATSTAETDAGDYANEYFITLWAVPGEGENLLVRGMLMYVGPGYTVEYFSTLDARKGDGK